MKRLARLKLPDEDGGAWYLAGCMFAQKKTEAELIAREMRNKEGAGKNSGMLGCKPKLFFFQGVECIMQEDALCRRNACAAI